MQNAILLGKMTGYPRRAGCREAMVELSSQDLLAIGG
jgi:hypothetical protein